MRLHVARDQARGAGAGAPAHRRLGRGARARAGGRRGRGSCSSRAAGPGGRRAATRGPCGPSTSRSRRWSPRSRSSSSRSATSVMRRAPAVARVGRTASCLLDHPQLGRGVPEVGLVLAVDQLVDRRRRRLAVEPAGAVVGARVGAVVGLAGDVQPELLEHRPVLLGLGAERGQEVAHHHPVEAGLDGQRLQVAEVLDPAAAEAEERAGDDQAEDRHPLDDLPGVHQRRGRRTWSPARGLSRLIGTEVGFDLGRARRPSRPAGAGTRRG